MNINEAEESYKYRFTVTYDGDNKIILFGQTCSRCNEYFENPVRQTYCLDCLSKFVSELRNYTRR
jgi:formylmethanofuran dehydrogenase subunit E